MAASSVSPDVAPRIARFGLFKVCLDTGELSRDGAGVRLQRRSFCVLQALLERPGQVVSRERLRSCLWAADTHVDFESGLNTAVNRLRAALGDSADQPVYVETLAKVGYRFIAPVTFGLDELKTVAPAKEDIAERPQAWAKKKLVWMVAALAVVLLGAIAWHAATTGRASSIPRVAGSAGSRGS